MRLKLGKLALEVGTHTHQVASSLDTLDGLLEDVDFEVHVTPLDFGETLPTNFGSRSSFFEVSLCAACRGVCINASARKLAMKDLHLKLEKLLTEAEDCDLIGKLATDKRKRKLFEKLAADLRGMARDIEAMIALKPNGGHIRKARRPSVCCHHNRLPPPRPQ